MRTQCAKCVMDKSAQEIKFNENGVCNFCLTAQKSLNEIALEKKNLSKILSKIKGKQYNCLMGLSGGIDSSYTLHKALELGLKPLCFSLDNGWNDPKTDSNIKKLVDKLKVPHLIYKIDEKIYRDLQSAFFRAGQINVEIPTDHILMALTYKIASQYGIKWVLSGGNVATESIMPVSWGYNARDLTHIKDIYRKMNSKKLKGVPTCGILKWNWYKWVKGIKILYLLDYLDYNKDEAIATLQRKYNYEPYAEKHCESTFTWWFQNFYLFEKFGIDKRKAHLSSLINSGQITRKQALKELSKNPVYPKLGIEDKVMKYERRPYTDFKTDEKLFRFISKIVRILQWR